MRVGNGIERNRRRKDDLKILYISNYSTYIHVDATYLCIQITMYNQTEKSAAGEFHNAGWWSSNYLGGLCLEYFQLLWSPVVIHVTLL